MQPYELTLTDAAEQLRTRALSPLELVDSVLDRIAATEPRLGAYVTVTAERARRAAREAGHRLAADPAAVPLPGIPVGLKDLIDVAGEPTTASSRVRSGHRAGTDSTVAARVTAAGAALVGKTHTHEFAYGLTTPQTRNAWDQRRVAGGSSGGSRRGGGRRRCDLRTGHRHRRIHPGARRAERRGRPQTDFRPRPPARCHPAVLVAGPRRPAHPHRRGLLPGPGRAHRKRPARPRPVAPARPRPHRAPRRGAPGNYFFDRVDPEVETAVRQAIGRLAELGARLVDVEIPMARYVQAVQWGLMVPEATAYHERTLRTVPELYAPDVRILLEAGALLPAADYLRAQRARTLMRQSWLRMLETVDLVAAPTVPTTAAEADRADRSRPDGTVESVSDSYVRLSAPADITGVPALTVPVGHDRAGLPIGMQLMGRPLEEAVLLRAGHAYERTRQPGTLAPVGRAPGGAGTHATTVL